MENAETMHSCFLNAVKNLNIPEFFKKLAGHISQPVLKNITELRNHPSIVDIMRKFTTQTFYFSLVNPIPHGENGV